MSDIKMSVVDHLAELRKRIIVVMVSALLATVILYFKVPILFRFLQKPLEKFNLELVYFSLTEGFAIRIKIAFLASVIITSPIILHQTMTFINPGLTVKEKRILHRVIFFSLFSFTAGMVLGYFFILPHFLHFLIAYSRSYLSPLLSGDAYFSFLAMFCFVIGIISEIPLLLIFLAKLRLLSAKTLRKWRKFVWTIVLLFSSIIAPATGFQLFICLVIPIIVLYEMCIWSVFLIEKKKSRKSWNY
jgi:sec-independent protein translocase protein TatC